MPPSGRPKVILDCDPGLDDAFAILCASRHCDLLGITTVNGNVGLPATTANALAVSAEIGLEVEIHAGAAVPLVAEPRDASHVHGESGLVGFEPTAPRTTATGADGVGFLLETTRRLEDVWVVAVGPLTNVALAIRLDPGFVDRIAGLVLMGGSAATGNVTAAAEFNVWADPEAAAIVFDAGVDPLMVGLDLTHQVCFGDPELEELAAAEGASAAMASGILGAYLDNVGAAEGARLGPMHDPCAVLALSHPELFEIEAHRVDIELAGTHTRGMTVIDQRRIGRQAPNARVAHGVDADAVRRLILDAAIDPLGATS